jgi:hypothetical protein
VPVLLRLQRLRATPQAEARGLLRVLFVRLGAMPADASGTAPRLSTKVGDVDGDGNAAPPMAGGLAGGLSRPIIARLRSESHLSDRVISRPVLGGLHHRYCRI